MASEINCSHTEWLRYRGDMDILRKKGLLRSHQNNDDETVYELPASVMQMLRSGDFSGLVGNKKLSVGEFFAYMDEVFEQKDRSYDNITYDDALFTTTELIKSNTQLQICSRLHKLAHSSSLDTRSIYLLIFFCTCSVIKDDNNIMDYQINDLFETTYDAKMLWSDLQDGSSPLIREGYIEARCENGLADNDSFCLTEKAKEELLSEAVKNMPKHELNYLQKWSQINEKALYYPPKTESSIGTLKSLLDNEEYQKVRTRLLDSKMRTGFACLFSGPPGTGKTEAALQLARATRRNIMKVNINEIRDKYVGETEKQIRRVFNRYREAVKLSDIAPILLFNEADAIIGKRTQVGDANGAVTKMENAMQNIILEEMENLDGILIATTNLKTNFDKAFERRFLYKIEFEKPTEKVREHIWRSLIPDLDGAVISELSGSFDLSGGQIENLARKRTVEMVLKGQNPNRDMLRGWCKEETSDIERRPIGFNT
jgi:hypothetical protein